jgi:hypothetical protein
LWDLILKLTLSNEVMFDPATQPLSQGAEGLFKTSRRPLARAGLASAAAKQSLHVLRFILKRMYNSKISVNSTLKPPTRADPGDCKGNSGKITAENSMRLHVHVIQQLYRFLAHLSQQRYMPAMEAGTACVTKPMQVILRISIICMVT